MSASLNHFGVYALTAEYHGLADEDREALGRRTVLALETAAPRVHHYRTFPTTADSDLIVWSAVPAEDPAAPGRFFHACASALRPFRRWLRPVDVLWGFTRPSEYSRARSQQAIDPFEARTLPYLVVYPFAKTAEWYRLDAAARQEMMNEHMRIGKQHPDVRQLLLYATGLQDHEFVVVYETPDLARFSQLVAELRHTEARRFTARDAPVRVGVHIPAGEPGAFGS
jgi:chlorite dismutase